MTARAGNWHRAGGRPRRPGPVTCETGRDVWVDSVSVWLSTRPALRKWSVGRAPHTCVGSGREGDGTVGEAGSLYTPPSGPSVGTVTGLRGSRSARAPLVPGKQRADKAGPSSPCAP